MAIDDALYWLGFSSFSGIGPKKFSLLLESFTSAQEAWKADGEALTSVLGVALAQKFRAFRQSFSLEAYREQLQRADVWFVTLQDKMYPPRLQQSFNPPFVLYGRGKKDVLVDDKMIGIVGTRKITSYGRQVTSMITQELSFAGYAIVSGLAMGVDAVAHATALGNNGKTIAVLGCGVDCCNPRSNQQLYEQIIQGNGCVISEFPLAAQPTVGSFPSRNRIIAGLSQGIVVTEGAADSGALITANDALKDQRPVFAVPGPITSSLSQGPHALLAKGATLVTSGKDVLRAFGEKVYRTQLRELPTGETKEEQMIIDLLLHEEQSFDQLIVQTQFSSSQLNILLSLMEMKGMITQQEKGTYSLVLDYLP